MNTEFPEEYYLPENTELKIVRSDKWAEGRGGAERRAGAILLGPGC